MRFLSSWRPPHRVGVIGVTLAMAAAGGFASPALAGPAAAAKRVSATPANGTPHLVRTSGKGTENVRQLVKCGSRMYAVGKFTKIAKGGKTYTRNNIFSFQATAPYTVSGLRVGVNGQVNTIAFTKRHGCRDAYLGGVFTSVHGTAAKNIVEVSTSTGAVVQRFGHNASGQVETLLGYRNHLLEGGDFTSTNDDGRPYYASLNPVTGEDDGFVGVRVSGNIPKGPTKVYNQQLSHNGKRLLVEGDFTSVGGLPRQQIFMLNVSGPHATVSAWTSPEFDQKCNLAESFYVRDAAWSPGDSTVYVADTGLHPRSWNNTFPLTGLCDAVAAFPATAKAVHHDWIEYSGCDSYYSVAADSSAVYAAGHMRWADNPRACNHAGPGAVPDQGLQGLSPGKGKAELNSRGKALYSMSRANADDLVVTGAGLWIASSNRFGSGMCGGVSGHTGICLLPYR